MKRAFIFAFLPFVCLSLELYSVVWCALILPIIAIIKHAMAFVFQFVSIVGIPRSFVELFDMLFTAALMPFRFFFGFVVLTPRNSHMAYDICADIRTGDLCVGELPENIKDVWQINNRDFLPPDQKLCFKR